MADHWLTVVERGVTLLTVWHHVMLLSVCLIRCKPSLPQRHLMLPLREHLIPIPMVDQVRKRCNSEAKAGQNWRAKATGDEL